MITTHDESVHSWYSRPDARHWRCAEPPRQPEDFHRSFPDYRHTPLVEIPAFAEELRVGRLFVKDESQRLGLPAFKMLGASWAVHQAMTSWSDTTDSTPRLDDLRNLAKRSGSCTLVTATDGNHGRALARMANLVGLPARIYVPDVVSPEAIALIREEGADTIVLSDDYNGTVHRAAQDAAEDPAALLVQDTAWDGYEEVPQWIVDGYSTLFRETDTQLTQQNAAPAALVAVPTGVGSLLQAAVAFYRSRPREPAAILAVEPTTANCVATSLHQKEPVTVPTASTTMAGLNCGTPSSIAWPMLQDGVDAAISVDDSAAATASADIGAFGISAGPCGAASLAGLRAALANDRGDERRNALGLTDQSSVVLLNTEGRHPSAS